MDPATHALIGVAISKLGGQQLSLQNPAFVGAVIGSVAPDIDIVLQKWGDYVYLNNHRGMSHSLIGLGIFSSIITLTLMLFYPQMDFLNVFFWTFLGCFFHSGMDLLNSYGVKLLWPFYNKKIAFGLIIVFDPVIFILLTLYIAFDIMSANMIFGGLICYIVLRIGMMYSIHYRVKKYFNVNWRNVNVLPSMLGVFKWHFIIRTSGGITVGEKSIFKRQIQVIEELLTIESRLLNRIMYTPIAKFFAEFTPFYHVVWNEAEKVFKFIDVRYYMKNTFLHHATAKVSDDFKVLDQKFHPYSLKRSVEIPNG